MSINRSRTVSDISAAPSAIVLEPGGGVIHEIMGPTVTFKTVGSQSDDQFVVMEATEQPGSGSPTQWHKATTVIIYVLEGTPTMQVGDETTQLGPGGYVYLPPRTTYAISNRSAAPAKTLWIVSPAGIERYIAEVMTLIANEPSWPPADMSKLIALREKYDFFDPPVR
jgi:glyoxylate utilization-related uncharacterized protein